jgi:hypothetical protein
MVVLSKFQIPELETPKDAREYRQWRGQIMANVTSIPGYLVRFNVAFGAIPVVPVAMPGGVPGQEMATSEGCLFAAIYGSLRGSPLQIITQRGITHIPGLMDTLDSEFNRLEQIDLSTSVARFYGDRFDGKSCLRTWISEKYSLVLECHASIPAGAARNAAMMYATTMLMPQQFDEITVRGRTEAGCTWEMMRSRLIDFDKANPASKREKQAREIAAIARNAANEVVRANLAANPGSVGGSTSLGAPPPANPTDDQDYVSANYAGEDGTFRGMCHNCKTYCGYTAKYCPNPKKGAGKKGVKKGNDKPWKGAGKHGKGGKHGKHGKGGKGNAGKGKGGKRR